LHVETGTDSRMIASALVNKSSACDKRCWTECHFVVMGRGRHAVRPAWPAEASLFYSSLFTDLHGQERLCFGRQFVLHALRIMA